MPPDLPEVAAAPVGAPLSVVRQAASRCRACPLWRNATQTVFGEGLSGARLVIVGEQPGDSEDQTGQPFVGPAGKMLDRALAAAGVDRSKAYVTNAVKHFKWEPRGKRRLHKTPVQREIEACRPWLTAELATIGPAVILCLGATAACSLLERKVRLGDLRGQTLAGDDGRVLIFTVHPSYLLRLRPPQAELEYQRFVSDLRRAAREAGL